MVCGLLEFSLVLWVVMYPCNYEGNGAQPCLCADSVSTLGNDLTQLRGCSQLFICFCVSVCIYKEDKAPNFFQAFLVQIPRKALLSLLRHVQSVQ